MVYTFNHDFICMTWLKISDESVMKVLKWLSGSMPWDFIDDEVCEPEGAYRKHVEDMVKRGVLTTDGRVVRRKAD